MEWYQNSDQDSWLGFGPLAWVKLNEWIKNDGKMRNEIPNWENVS